MPKEAIYITETKQILCR